MRPRAPTHEIMTEDSELPAYAHRILMQSGFMNSRFWSMILNNQYNDAGEAISAVRRFVYSDNTFLTLMGNPGTGKTFACAFGARLFLVELFKLNPDTTFGTAGNPTRMNMSDLEATRVYDDNWNRWKNSKFLLIDDLATDFVTGHFIGKLTDIINYRYERDLKTLVTTNLTTAEIKTSFPRLWTRLIDPDRGEVWSIEDSNFRGLLNVSDGD